MSERELRMIQYEATSLATNCITENKSNDKGPDSVVAVVVESPTKESINSP